MDEDEKEYKKKKKKGKGKIKKKFCKLMKEEKKPAGNELRELAADSCYVCKKCGRAAHEKKVLCKPTEL